MWESELAELFDYLETTDRALRTELAGLELNQVPLDGGWSAGQILAHLNKTERYLYPLFKFGPTLGSIPGLLEMLDRLNLRLCRLTGMRFMRNGASQPPTLDTISRGYSGRFMAPAFLRPKRRQYALDELLIERLDLRARTLQAVQDADPIKLSTLQFSHPILGRYSLVEFLFFIARHEEWHTEQLKRLRIKLVDNALGKQ
jgi:hypothetical protein